ncbi:hypothetical protein HRbin15_01593 [bacterium HR15]|nr:hypothetical protein HRbin15_01593 [bacterium HR15]
MALPKNYEELVQQVIHEAEQQSEWPLTSLEKFAIERGVLQGIEKGLQQGLLLLLEARFGSLTPEIEARIKLIDNPDLLRALYQFASHAESLDAFTQQLQDQDEAARQVDQP